MGAFCITTPAQMPIWPSTLLPLPTRARLGAAVYTALFSPVFRAAFVCPLRHALFGMVEWDGMGWDGVGWDGMGTERANDAVVVFAIRWYEPLSVGTSECRSVETVAALISECRGGLGGGQLRTMRPPCLRPRSTSPSNSSSTPYPFNQIETEFLKLILSFSQDEVAPSTGRTRPGKDPSPWLIIGWMDRSVNRSIWSIN